MARGKKTPFRIVGGNGEWFAYRAFGDLPRWAPHCRKIAHPSRKGLVWRTAVKGRTPFEALERLKRFLGVV